MKKTFSILSISAALVLLSTLSGCSFFYSAKPVNQVKGVSLKTFTHIEKPPELRIKDLQSQHAKNCVQNQHNHPPKKTKISDLAEENLEQNQNLGETLAWPLKGKVVITFAEQLQQRKVLPGIHILAHKNCPVKAATTGVVSYSGAFSSSMNVVIVKSYPDLQIAYGYLDSQLPKIGEKVYAGQTIGYVKGKNDRPVLYFAVKKKGSLVDPLKYLK